MNLSCLSIVCRAALPAVLLWIAAGASLGAVEIIAHRGASYDAPENTLSAMKLGWTQQSDAIELDLWLSKDGRLVVFHDSDTRRMGGPARSVAEQTWAELQQVDVGAWKHPRFKGERIPTLEAILATIPPQKRAVLEIKCGPEIVPELRRTLEAAGRKPAELAIISFNFNALKASKEAFLGIQHYFLSSYKPKAAGSPPPTVEGLIARAKAAGFDGLNLEAGWPIDQAFVQTVNAAGLKLLVWTVDDPAVARRLVKAGIDGLTTNRPGWMREQLAKD